MGTSQLASKPWLSRGYRPEYFGERIDQNPILLFRAYGNADRVGNMPGNEAPHDAAFVLDTTAKLYGILGRLDIKEICRRGNHAQTHLLEPRRQIGDTLGVSFDGQSNVSFVL